ncbi:hypothetical protein BGS_0560 [Beggiatoa sp. SS]|nr:hypothetical protein BGS_0560 [Beggiatoa sp. SS]
MRIVLPLVARVEINRRKKTGYFLLNRLYDRPNGFFGEMNPVGDPLTLCPVGGVWADDGGLYPTFKPLWGSVCVTHDTLKLWVFEQNTGGVMPLQQVF